jgi:hypothetical protein
VSPETNIDRLASLLDSIREFGDLADDAVWQARARAAVNVTVNVTGLEAEMRDLLRLALDNLDVRAPLDYQHRVQRAVSEWKGIVKPGQDIERQCRWRYIGSAWSEWQLIPADGFMHKAELSGTKREFEIRIAAANITRRPQRWAFRLRKAILWR